jgi:sugar lactone lactonase YvrE
MSAESNTSLTVLLDSLAFPEGPRWHEGQLWFSDMYARRVMTVDPSGRAETIVEVPGQPSGLGWLPNGRLLVVSMTDRRLLRLDEDGTLREHADLSPLASFHCNDMVVDGKGNAYVGNFGFDLAAGAPQQPGEIILVTAEDDARVVAGDLRFPNGSVVTPEGRTLIVAQTFGACLTAFTIEPDGSLSNRRVWAELPGITPDGICLDCEGAIWVTSPGTGEMLRVREGGEITHRVTTTAPPFACMLGGTDRRTLFVLTAPTFYPEQCRVQRGGQIQSLRVDIAGAGFP